MTRYVVMAGYCGIATRLRARRLLHLPKSMATSTRYPEQMSQRLAPSLALPQAKRLLLRLLL
jgi:hypothetical protein